MPDPKTYVPRASVKEHVFPDGGKLLKIGFHAETVAAFLKEHANEKGFVNLVVARRKQPGQYGETHTLYLDTYKPKGSPDGQSEAQRTLAQRKASQPIQPPPSDDEVPF